MHGKRIIKFICIIFVIDKGFLMSFKLWRHIALTLIAYACCMPPAAAQFPSWETFVEQLHIEYEEGSQEMFESVYEDFSYLHANPININSADSTELKSLGFLTDWQIEGIHCYIHRHGALQSVGELLLIPELDYHTRQLLSYFITFGPLKEETVKWSKAWCHMLTQGRSELTTRLDIPLYQIGRAHV